MLKKFKFWFTLLSGVIILVLWSFDEPNEILINKVLFQLQKFRNQYHPQKVYLQTDKSIYLSPENIWIKSYLVNASTHLSDSLSKEVYVDLVDFNNQPVRTIIIRNNNGFGQGNIQLSDTLIAGIYRLRAYTNWMRNFDENLFFTKNIEIKNPNYENIVTKKRIVDLKQFNRLQSRKQQHIDIHFMPEGGNLVIGLPCKMAFLVENSLGDGIKARGTLFENKIQIDTFNTVYEGMGYFKFTPKAGAKYSCTFNYGKKEYQTVSLPPAQNMGIVMAVDYTDSENIYLKLQSNRDISANIASNEVIIFAQSRNTPVYVSKVELKSKPIDVEIPRYLFPAGVAQITLFDARLDPVCERLVFINPDYETSLNRIKLTKLERNDSSLFSVELKNKFGNPVKANLSASVCEFIDNQNQDVSPSILSHFLLTSDLNGKISNPRHYFNNTPQASEHADLLMLTHGWRRFVWKEIISNQYPEITCPADWGITVGGRITRDFFEIPIPDSKVQLTIKSSYNDVFETKTDKKGRFFFPNLNYEDTIDVLIEAFKPSGGRGLLIILSDTLVPKMVTPISKSPLNIAFDRDKIKANIKRERVEFKKNYKERKPDNQDYKIHQTPNDVIYVGDDVVNYSDILSYMQGRIPGVNITGNKVIIRGINTFYGSTDPLFLLDGVPIDAATVPMLNPQDIAIIEVLKGPEAAIYGSRGSNGVIAFYTHRGHFMKRGVLDFGMLGYHKVREYYTPYYDNWKYKPQDYHVPRTLIWKPELITSKLNGTAKFGYKNKFNDSQKMITIEGLTENGELIFFENTPSQQISNN